MIIRNTLISACTAVVLLSTSAAIAGSYDTFANLDINQDGVITHNELIRSPDLARDFRMLDRDHSGGLNPRELDRGLMLQQTAKRTSL